MKMESSNGAVSVLFNYMKEFPPARLRRIRRRLAEWYEANRRDLPWRRTRDPYRIWISEIMLQQTRVAAVVPFYERFLTTFPDVAALAAAGDTELLQAWTGLGYYSRVRNLRAAARLIVARGSFPDSYTEILALPGVGPYTAAAISSISFGLPEAVLDGNVMRVLARLTLNDKDIRSGDGRAELQAGAQKLLDRANPAGHNQAVMELGATICVPRVPKCKFCPIIQDCQAYISGMATELPVIRRKAENRRLRRTLLVVIRNGNILLWQRAQDAALLAGFWELPEPDQLPEAQFDTLLHEFSHAITNHIYHFHVMMARADRVSPVCQWVPLGDLSAFPLSTVTRKALRGVTLPV